MAQNFEACKKALCRMKDQGHNDIIDSKCIPERLKEPNLQDQEGLGAADMAILPKIRLYEGVHRMGPTEVRCLILKLEKFDQDKFNSFQLLKNFRNSAVVTLQAFCEDAVFPRIALSWVDKRFDDHVRTYDGCKMLFKDQQIGQSRSYSPLLRRFIINICSGLESLFKVGLYPPEIKMDDLYLCNYGTADVCVKMLLLSVENIKEGTASRDRKEKLWKEVRDLVEQIKRISDNTVARYISRTCKGEVSAIPSAPWNKVDACFIQYIGHDVDMLERHPDMWTGRKKGEYLLSIGSADEEQIRKRLQRHGVLKWPVDPNTKKFPDLLNKLILNEKKRIAPFPYNTNDPYHYVVLCRTTYKHFDALRKQVSALKDQCDKAEDFCGRMERWNPEIWCILYDAIGVPDAPQG